MKAFLSFSSLPFSLPSFPFSPETPDAQATGICCELQSYFDTLLHYAVTFCGAVVLKVRDQKTLVKRR